MKESHAERDTAKLGGYFLSGVWQTPEMEEERKK